MATFWSLSGCNDPKYFSQQYSKVAVVF